MSRVLLTNQFSQVGVSCSSKCGGNHAGADLPALDKFKTLSLLLQGDVGHMSLFFTLCFSSTIFLIPLVFPTLFYFFFPPGSLLRSWLVRREIVGSTSTIQRSSCRETVSNLRRCRPLFYKGRFFNFLWMKRPLTGVKILCGTSELK